MAANKGKVQEAPIRTTRAKAKVAKDTSPTPATLSAISRIRQLAEQAERDLYVANIKRSKKAGPAKDASETAQAATLSAEDMATLDSIRAEGAQYIAILESIRGMKGYSILKLSNRIRDIPDTHIGALKDIRKTYTNAMDIEVKKRKG